MSKSPVKIGIPKWSDKELVLNLVMGSFAPGKELNIIPQELQKTETQDYDYYIIQFKGPILREWKEAVEKEGVILQNYLPNYAFIAGMKRDIVNTVFSKEYVNYIGIYQPYYKILVDKYSGSKELNIWVFSKEKIQDVVQKLRSQGFAEVKIHDENIIRARGTYSQVIMAAKLTEV
ncbi:MAG: hypothetical protein QXO75_11490, partial [Nitrososphaerota archaeon]